LEKEYGRVTYFSSGYVDMSRPAFVQSLRDRIQQKIRESTSSDFVYFQGFGVVTALVVKEWFVKHGQLNLIIRRRRDSRFIVVGIT
jgi:hypothetical protein